MKRIFYAFFIFALSAVALSGLFSATAQAQTTSTDSSINYTPTALPGETPAQTQARLQAALASVEAEQQQAEDDLTKTQAQSASLTRDISVLNGQIKVA